MRTFLVATMLCFSPALLAQTPKGEVSGQATVHTAASAAAVVRQAAVVLPAKATGGDVFVGSFADVPAKISTRVPVVVFLHGSSGLKLKAIGEWQRGLAELGIASIAPDSFALPDRLTYKSPIPQETYEQIHALRQSEIELAVKALQDAPWADTSRMVLAGTSEGAVSVARYAGNAFKGRILYAWSCEDNYFVKGHATALPSDQPILNVISTTDPFFSPANPWIGNAAPAGHCGPRLSKSQRSSVVLIPDAPHTLLTFPAARAATDGFLRDVLLSN